MSVAAYSFREKLPGSDPRKQKPITLRSRSHVTWWWWYFFFIF